MSKQFNNLFEEIANSIGGGGIAGARMGEDPPVKKRKPTENDYLADPDDVETEDNDQIKEKYNWKRVGGGTTWDATLMVGGKLAYDKIAGPYLGTTPIDMTKYAIAAAGVALVMNMAHEYIRYHKKYPQKAMKALEIARKKLQTDRKFRDRVHAMAAKKKLNEAFWDVKDKPYSPWKLRITGTMLNTGIGSAIFYAVYTYFVDGIEKPTDGQQIDYFKELWDTKLFLLMCLAGFAAGVSKDYFIRYAKKHVDASKWFYEVSKRWKDKAFREDASRLVKSYYSYLVKLTKFGRDYIKYKDRQFEALEAFKRKWFRDNISPAPQVTIEPPKLKLKENQEPIELHELFIKRKPKIKKLKSSLKGDKRKQRQRTVMKTISYASAAYKVIKPVAGG